MRTFYLSSVYGAALALEQVLERSDITKDDQLIFAGDVNGPWPDTMETLNILCQYPNLKVIHGTLDTDFVNLMTNFKSHPLITEYMSYYSRHPELYEEFEPPFRNGVLLQNMPAIHTRFFLNSTKAVSLPGNILATYAPNLWNINRYTVDPWLHEFAQRRYGTNPLMEKRLGTRLICSHIPTVQGLVDTTTHIINVNCGSLYPEGCVAMVELSGSSTTLDLHSYYSDHISSFYSSPHI